jgi:hypothetical protein
MGAEVRRALIVASDTYDDPGLRQLRAPAADARALARVLGDPMIGGFDVTSVVNRPAHEVNLAVEDFFADRSPDDLLLVHFSCHGVKDEGGDLYFAMTDTRMRRLGATGVSAEFVNRRMARSRSRRVVLLLDCCYAGAFERGMVHRADSGVGIESKFGGRGRAVVTASSAVEYAFEGDVLTDSADVSPSIFTSALVTGLESGDADRDQDGLIALDELYEYVYEKVRSATPNQTPGKWTFGVEGGELVIARRSRPVTTPSPLPDELRDAITSPLAPVRAVAVEELTRLLGGTHAGLSLGARLALRQLTNDDSRTVASSAAAALEAVPDDPPGLTSTLTSPLSAPPSAPGEPAPSRPVTAAAKPPPRLRRRPTRRWTAIGAGLVLLVAAAVVTIALVNRDGGAISSSEKDALLQGIPTSIEEGCDAMTTDADGLPTVVCDDGRLSFTLVSSEDSAIETVGDAEYTDECQSSVEQGRHELTLYSLNGHQGTLRCTNAGGASYAFTWHDDTTPRVIGRYTLRASFDTVRQQWEGIVTAG